MKAKLAALDDLIEQCDNAIAGPSKMKRKKPEPMIEEEKDEDTEMLDKKAEISSKLKDVDLDDLLAMYEKLRGK